jgi:hypothetical protein
LIGLIEEGVMLGGVLPVRFGVVVTTRLFVFVGHDEVVPMNEAGCFILPEMTD